MFFHKFQNPQILTKRIHSVQVLEWVFRFLSASIQVLTAGTRPCCRFTPSCSEYAAHSIHRHGIFKGLKLTANRLSRCRPGTDWGVDPVPTHWMGSNGEKK